MLEPAVARVVIDSPLLQLDKVFDYSIPESMVGSIAIGSLVQVKIGSAGGLKFAYVVDLATSSEHKLKPLAALVSHLPHLPSSQYRLLREIADRNACGLGDLLKLAIPDRMVRVEQGFSLQLQDFNFGSDGALTTAVSMRWQAELLNFAKLAISRGESALLITPDFRSHQSLMRFAAESGLSAVDWGMKQTKSQRYLNYLTAQNIGAQLIIGNRSAIFAPLQNLGFIGIYNEADESLIEQTAPYYSIRDIALIKQKLHQCALHFVSPSRSTDLQRLVNLGYIRDMSNPASRPKVSFDSDNPRDSAAAYAAIREGLLTGAVLIQIPNKGIAKSCYCQDCSKRATCHACNGPLWIDSTNIPRCRWCNGQNLHFQCKECHSTRLKQGKAGTARSSAEFGKAFPGSKVVESTSENRVLTVKGKNLLVVSTPGAEPECLNGYSAVVILDAPTLLNTDSLRAQEHAVRKWCRAISLLSESGRAVVAGIPQTLGQQLALWHHVEIAQDQLAERSELRFPPIVRLASVQGETMTLARIAQKVKEVMPQVEVLGPIQVRNGPSLEGRYVFKFSYADGLALANLFRELLVIESPKASKAGTGRMARAVRLRMDDSEVI